MDIPDSEESFDLSTLVGHSHEAASTYLGPQGQGNARPQLSHVQRFEVIPNAIEISIRIASSKKEVERMSERLNQTEEETDQYQKMIKIQAYAIQELEKRLYELKEKKRK